MGENFAVSGPGFIPGAPPLNSIDTGVFINELTNLGLLPDKHEIVPFSLGPETTAGGETTEQAPVPDTSQQITYRGTQLALLKTYGIIEHRHHSFMEAVDLDSSLPPPNRTAEKKRRYYSFSHDEFPPHLKLARKDNEESPDQRLDLPLDKIFDSMRLKQSAALMRGFLGAFKRFVAAQLAKNKFGSLGTPSEGQTLREVEEYNREKLNISKDFKGKEQNKPKNDIFDQPNVGELEDWYSDAAFAQQQFTGVNPTTITQASDKWLERFLQASNKHEDEAITDIIKDLKNSSRESLYMQDYSYFRTAANMEDAEDIKQKWETGVWPFNNKTGFRYSCAAVCLYYLNEKGQLYPLAVVIDWRGSPENSVTIFNRTLFKSRNLKTGVDSRNSKKQLEEEENDWPWRYAKTCVQSSDWFQHEVTAYLTNTHFIEEAIIVASNRQFNDDHAVLQLLKPHWRKTLALNAAARSTLVPHVVLDLVGFSKDQALDFIRDAYAKFKFEENYVPTELKNRGFPPEKLGDEKFHNYAYAKCINSMWWKIREFVKGMLAVTYPEPQGEDKVSADGKVQADKQVQAWVKELKNANGANLTFPEIQTFDALVDCVTMCIHIASPQHTAVNYLQNYYLSFVVNKPPCLFEKPPQTREELLRYTEQDLVKALPMNKPAEWLLASHIPYLLNKQPDEDETLYHYAQSAAGLFRTKPGESNQAIAKAATDFLLSPCSEQTRIRELRKASGWLGKAQVPSAVS